MNNFLETYTIRPQDDVQTTVEKTLKGFGYAAIPLSGSAVCLLTGCYHLIKTGSPLGSTMIAAGLGILVLGMKEQNQQAIKLGAGVALFGAYGLMTTSSGLSHGLLITGLALGCIAGLQISTAAIKIPLKMITGPVDEINRATKPSPKN